MIQGNSERPIAWYLPIAHGGEDYDPVKPAEGEEFVGFPYGGCSDNSLPFIEVRRDGKCIRTVNALDCSNIGFVE